MLSLAELMEKAKNGEKGEETSRSQYQKPQKGLNLKGRMFEMCEEKTADGEDILQVQFDIPSGFFKYAHRKNKEQPKYTKNYDKSRFTFETDDQKIGLINQILKYNPTAQITSDTDQNGNVKGFEKWEMPIYIEDVERLKNDGGTFFESTVIKFGEFAVKYAEEVNAIAKTQQNDVKADEIAQPQTEFEKIEEDGDAPF
jgi:hypothetical protein